jgi:3-isopropylmalate dehydratase small subunit
MEAITKSSDPYAALEQYAFAGIRYLEGDAERGIPNPEFALNDNYYANAKILLTGENFGCGSSRETAPAALQILGIDCLIGTTYGDIFFNNCLQRGILPIRLDPTDFATCIATSRQGEFVVDLPNQTIIKPDKLALTFDINPFRKNCLLSGLDDISMTLEHEPTIRDFQARDRLSRPWIY